MCTWEQPESREMPSLRQRLPAMMERIWQPSIKNGAAAAGKPFDDFDRRLNVVRPPARNFLLKPRD